MSLAIISPGKNPNAWIKVIRKLDPTLKIQVYPTTVLAGPDGTIHAFVQGYVAADQFQDQLVRTSSIVQLDVKIQRELADARAASEAGQFPVAIANAQRLVMISKGKPSEAKAKQLLEELEATATQEYASANQDARSLTKFAQNYAGSTSAQKAETQLLALRGGDRQQFGLPTLVYPDPAGKPGQLLIAARDFQQAGAYAEALELCEMLKGTSESQQVEQIVNQIQSDPIKLAEATKQVNDRIATRQIALAEAWQKNGKPVEAEKCLETALKICPTGPRAEVARGFLTKLREGLSAIPAVLKRQ